MAIAIAIVHYNGSTLNQEIFALHHVTAGATTGYQNVTNSFSRNRVLNSLPLYLFWGGVGLITYTFSMRIINGFSNAIQIEEELTYVHSNHRGILVTAFTQLLVRLCTLLVWLVVILETLHHLLPDSLVKAHTLGIQFSATALKQAVWLTFVLILDLMLQTVFMRILALRSRVLSNNT